MMFEGKTEMNGKLRVLRNVNDDDDGDKGRLHFVVLYTFLFSFRVNIICIFPNAVVIPMTLTLFIPYTCIQLYRNTRTFYIACDLLPS